MTIIWKRRFIFSKTIDCRTWNYSGSPTSGAEDSGSSQISALPSHRIINAFFCRSLYYIASACAQICKTYLSTQQEIEEGRAQTIQIRRHRTQRFMEKLITPPVLALPRLNGQYTINTDVCDTQVECVLLQKQKYNLLKLIGYWSC